MCSHQLQLIDRNLTHYTAVNRSCQTLNNDYGKLRFLQKNYAES